MAYQIIEHMIQNIEQRYIQYTTIVFPYLDISTIRGWSNNFINGKEKLAPLITETDITVIWHGFI